MVLSTECRLTKKPQQQAGPRGRVHFLSFDLGLCGLYEKPVGEFLTSARGNPKITAWMRNRTSPGTAAAGLLGWRNG